MAATSGAEFLPGLTEPAWLASSWVSMRTPLKCASLIPAIAGLVLIAAEPALASTFDRALERCREEVGRPIVRACLEARGQGGTFELCRLEASPKVRACVQDAMANGASNAEQAIAHCRQMVGRRIVAACMHEQGKRAELEGCRARASPSVRTCMRRAMIAVHGRAYVEQVIDHCRQTVGRPMVRACMGGNRGGGGADIQACRAQASPRVRACVQRTLRAA